MHILAMCSVQMIKMIKSARETRILDMLQNRSPRTISEFLAAIPGVSAVSIRRDVARLAERGLLERTHGGAAALPLPASLDDTEAEEGVDGLDAIILPPLEGRALDTLRLSARRRAIPFLAESSPQEGGVYLGPDNAAAGRDLGIAAGTMLAGKLEVARLLLVSLESLANTRARGDAFLEGFVSAFPGKVEHWRFNGEGSFKTSLQVSLDAFNAIPGLNVVFGVNDHSVLAALEAADQIGAHPYGFSVGGEGSRLFEMLASRRKLHACAALFPEIVGMRGIDVLADAFAGAPLPPEVRTPHAIVTADNNTTASRAKVMCSPSGRPRSWGCRRRSAAGGDTQHRMSSASCRTIRRTTGTAIWRGRCGPGLRTSACSCVSRPRWPALRAKSTGSAAPWPRPPRRA